MVGFRNWGQRGRQKQVSFSTDVGMNTKVHIRNYYRGDGVMHKGDWRNAQRKEGETLPFFHKRKEGMSAGLFI